MAKKKKSKVITPTPEDVNKYAGKNINSFWMDVIPSLNNVDIKAGIHAKNHFFDHFDAKDFLYKEFYAKPGVAPIKVGDPVYTGQHPNQKYNNINDAVNATAAKYGLTEEEKVLNEEEQIAKVIYETAKYFRYMGVYSYDNLDTVTDKQILEKFIEIAMQTTIKPFTPVIVTLAVDTQHYEFVNNGIRIVCLGVKDYSAQMYDKEKLFIVKEIKDQITLFEYPFVNGIQVRTENILFLDPYKPNEEDLTQELYHKNGVLIVKKFNIDDAEKILTIRKGIFDNAPSASNTILLFTLMDAIILHNFKEGKIDVDSAGEKSLIRLDKLKNLATSTKFHEERKNAVDKCFIQFRAIMVKKLVEPSNI